jgi:hypothetical protein
MKIALDVNEQNALLGALQMLDGYEVAASENGQSRILRVPFRLGAARRAVVKNINLLRTALTSFEQTRAALQKESWPALPLGTEVKKADDPEAFARYEAALLDVIKVKEEFELLPLPGALMYGDSDFPASALAVLDTHQLIDEAA